MITEINTATLSQVKNPAFARYAQRYIEIGEDYLSQIRASGIEIAPPADSQETETRLERLQALGVTFRNDGKSLVANRISPACEACQTGVGTATFFVSLRCHRSCFYCFNPNQENYDFFLEHTRDLPAELEKIAATHKKIGYLALTGGEPLLYKDETLAFFRACRRLFPKAHTRLYTSGDHADEGTLKALQEAGLDEIRLSIRLHDSQAGRRHTLERLALARQFIPQVMVEMPVLPDALESMQALLLDLDRIAIHSINLLEFCYPLNNAEEFNRRGYQVKNPPHRVLYNYWYAGGLPVAGSEKVCLDLLAFAVEQGLQMGVHYCSLENKHTGQLYQQNLQAPNSRLLFFSEKDYFLKTAKVFGEDVQPVWQFFKRQNLKEVQYNAEMDYLEFPLRKIHSLRRFDVQVGISYQVLEKEHGESLLREVKVDWTTPQIFDLAVDG